MAYIVIQGSKGFVSLVEKGRVRQGDGSNPSRTIRGICGLGNMTKEEYYAFQEWAHSFKDQEERKAMVLSSGRAITVREKTVKAVAADRQRKTTVQRPPQQKRKDISKVTILDKAAHQKILDKEKELQSKRDKEDIKEDIKIIKQPIYKIDDLTKAQQYEAEIKTLRGDNANKSLIIERERKIKYILGDKYKTCKEIAIAANKGEVIIKE